MGWFGLEEYAGIKKLDILLVNNFDFFKVNFEYINKCERVGKYFEVIDVDIVFRFMFSFG